MAIYSSTKDAKERTARGAERADAHAASLGIVDVWKLVHEPSYIRIETENGAESHPSAPLVVNTYLELLVLHERLIKAATDHEMRLVKASIICTAYPTVDFRDAYGMDGKNSDAIVLEMMDAVARSSVVDYMPERKVIEAAEKPASGTPKIPDPVWFGRIVADLVDVYGFPHSDVMDMEMGWFWNYVANSEAIQARRKMDMIEAFMSAMRPFHAKEGGLATGEHMAGLAALAMRKPRGTTVGKVADSEASDTQLTALRHHPFMGRFIEQRRRPEKAPGLN